MTVLNSSANLWESLVTLGKSLTIAHSSAFSSVQSLSHVQILATPWTAAHQGPPSMGFSRQEYWRGVSLPSPFRGSAMSNSLQSHGLQYRRLPCPSPTPEACSNSCSSSRWCNPTISTFVIPFSCLQSFPASGFFPMSQPFASGGQSIGVSASASVVPKNVEDWFPLLINYFSKWLYHFAFPPAVNMFCASKFLPTFGKLLCRKRKKWI